MADRSELKAVDEAFAYNSGVTFLTVHMVETLLDMNSELAKIDELLVDAGVEGIYHTNQEENICYSAEMLGELLAYSSDLAFYALELIDKPLYKNFNLNATESISRIKVEDYSTENTLGITYTAHTSHGDYENCAKKTLSIEDFLGVTAPENGGNLSNIPKEFSDFSNQYVTMYENLKANLVDEDGNQITLEEYLDQLVSMGEFSHTKDQPFRQFLSAVLDITIILPLIEACTGTDYITDEDLSDFERGMKGVGAVVGAFSLGTSYVAMKGAGFATQEILMNMGKAVAIDAASTTTSYWTGYACNEMGLPLPLTLMLSMGVGMGTSYGLNRVVFGSGSDLEIYKNADKTNSGIDEEAALPTAFKQKEFNSTYEERINQTPGPNNKIVEFKEVDLRGESKCTLKPPPDAELHQILSDAGIDGIEYKNGVPDFSPVSKKEISGIDMTNGRTGKNGSFTQANNKLAEELNNSPELVEQLGITKKGQEYTASDVSRYMSQNKLTWHELNDMTTVQMVPTKVNSTFGHLGGISEASKLK